MLWIKSLHLIFVISWFAGLFYLPRIFVNLALVEGPGPERDRLLLMAGKLIRFMLPLALLAVALGVWLWLGYGIGKNQLWMLAKLALVLVLIGYHVFCGSLLAAFRENRNKRSHRWFRWFNEAPVLLLAAIVILVVVKPGF